MYHLNFSIDRLKEEFLFKAPCYFKNGFIPTESSLQSFYRNIFDTQKGAHRAFGGDRSLIKIMYQGEEVSPDSWTHQFPGDEGYYRDIHALKKAIQNKCSIIFDQYYRYCHDIKSLSVFLQSMLGCAVGCNAYLSQQDAIAYPIHRDSHHVLVFALSGKKRWKVYNCKQQMVPAHYRVMSDLSDEDITEKGLDIEVEMSPGDILYIPIGQFHSVENLSDNALHVTFSLSFKPALEILSDLVTYISSESDQLDVLNATILNQVNPICHQNQASGGDVSHALKILFKAIEQVALSDQFLKKHKKPETNPHLTAFIDASDQLIEELTGCSA